MKSSLLSVLAVSAALLSAVAQPSRAQQFFSDHMIEPASNQITHADKGIKVRTFIHLMKTTTRPQRGARPMLGTGPYGGMTPAQVRSGYDIPANKGSKIIAIVDAYDYVTALADFNTFSAQFGLPVEKSADEMAKTNKTFQKIYASGTQPQDAGLYGWDIEEALDIEWAHAMAPKAKILLIEANSNSYDDLFQAVDAAAIAKAKEVSMSWLGEEFSGETAYDAHFPLKKGIVYFAASGDYGSPYFGSPSGYPAASPFVIAVGGTTFVTQVAGGYLYDIGWESGGGSPSVVETKPAFQKGVPNTDPAYRSIPDIAAIADPYTGVCVYNSNYAGWNVIGGTSAATPIMAGIVNAAGSFLLDSVAENTKIYSGLGSTNIIDVQHGFNGYPCLPGYDFVTGVGVPHGLSGL